MYGIDKSEVRNITIEAVNLRLLRHNTKAIFNVSESQDSYIVKVIGSDDHLQLDRLYIKDNYMFNDLTLDFKYNSLGVKVYYVSLDITINTKGNSENNLRPLSVSEYRNKLNNIRDYLISMYGVYISFNNGEKGHSRLRSIELNITSKMDHKFEDYKVLFEAIRQERNIKTYPNYVPHENKLKYGTHYFYSKSIELKFYDKTQQLYDSFKIRVDGEYMRIEYTLNGYDKIKEKLGTDDPFSLTDEQIISFLDESIENDVFKPIQKYINKTNKALAKKYREIKKQYKRGYIREFAHYCNSKDSEIFDIEQCFEIVKRDMIKSNSHNYTYNKKLIDSIMSQSLKHNFEKLEELKAKFQMKKASY